MTRHRWWVFDLGCLLTLLWAGLLAFGAVKLLAALVH